MSSSSSPSPRSSLTSYELYQYPRVHYSLSHSSNVFFIANHFTFRDVLDEAANISIVVLPFDPVEAVIMLYFAQHSVITPSLHGQIVQNGMEMKNAIDFMNMFGAMEVKYHFSRPSSVHAGVNALTSIMRNSASNDCLPTARSMNQNNRAHDLFNALRLGCKNNNLGWSPSLSLTTGKQFLDTIATVLFYYLDPHRANFIARGRPLWHIPGVDAIYNDLLFSMVVLQLIYIS